MFDKVTTIEAEMLKRGFDGIEIKGREIVNFTPLKDVMYFQTERALQNYHDDLVRWEQMEIEEQKKRNVGMAPNGQPSNLDLKQWAQVRTPEFKAWFGDWENNPKEASKILDENGEPMVMYHGTNQEFDVFDKIRLGDNTGRDNASMGFFFIPDAQRAREFAKENGEGEILIGSYLNIRNPIDLTIQGIFNTPHQASVLVDILSGSRMIPSRALRWLNDNIGLGELQDMQEAIYNTTAKAMMENRGFDGIISSFGTEDSKDILEYVAFEPTQIKSATDNAGTFDSNNPSILFQLPGNKSSNLTPDQQVQVRTPEFKKWAGSEWQDVIKDENGEPKELYHGTSYWDTFDKFKKGSHGLLGPGIYFTDKKSNAESYTRKNGDGGRVIAGYVKMANPFRISGGQGADVLLDTLYNSKAVFKRRSDKQGNINYIVTAADIKKLRDKGYDGIIWEHPASNEYVVFDPVQVKSSTANSGAFSNRDPRYLFQEPSTTKEAVLNRIRAGAPKIAEAGIPAAEIHRARVEEFGRLGITVDDINAVLMAHVRPQRDPLPLARERNVSSSQVAQDISAYTMSTSNEVGKMLSGVTWENVFGEKPEGNQMYFKQKLVEMLQDAQNMIQVARKAWGPDLMVYGKPLFNLIREMSDDVEMNNKKAVMLATFLGELQEAKLTSTTRVAEISRLEREVLAYYQHYMNVQGKRVAAGRLLRVFRDKFLEDFYSDMILEEQELREKKAILEALNTPLDRYVETERRITEEQKEKGDAAAEKKSKTDKVKKDSKKAGTKDAAKSKVSVKEKSILKKTGLPDMQSFIDRVRNSTLNRNCP